MAALAPKDDTPVRRPLYQYSNGFDAQERKRVGGTGAEAEAEAEAEDGNSQGSCSCRE